MYNILLGVYCLFITSIYSLSFTDTDGNTVTMNQFQGKKILLVNIATGSPRVNQLADLQQLQQQYGDSLVIIAFPSNSFGNESRSDAAIKQFCRSNYGATYRIAAKNSVLATGLQPIYSWLADISENGMMTGVVGGDFQKFLIDKEGNLVGVFSPSVKPTHSSVISAITGN